MSNANIQSRIAQVGDGILALLSRLLAGPVSGIALASAARTASTSSSDIETKGFRGIALWLNCTAAGASGGLTVYVQTQDPVSGNWCLSYVTSAVISTVRITSIFLAPGVSQGNNMSLPTGQADRGIMLPSKIRLYVVHSDAASYTYSLAYELLP